MIAARHDVLVGLHGALLRASSRWSTSLVQGEASAGDPGETAAGAQHRLQSPSCQPLKKLSTPAPPVRPSYMQEGFRAACEAYYEECTRASFKLLAALSAGLGLAPHALHPLFEVRCGLRCGLCCGLRCGLRCGLLVADQGQ